MSKTQPLKPFLTEILSKYSKRPAFSIYRKGLHSFSFLEVFSFILQMTEEIKKIELKPEDKIAIILESCPEYSIAFFACGLLNHPVVLIDAKLNIGEQLPILKHSDAKLIITGFNAKENALKAAVEVDLPVILIDEVEVLPLSKKIALQKMKTFDGLKEEDLALLVYTSGTTSDPKGVMITLGNLLFNGIQVIKAVGKNPKQVFLSILPMNHLLEFSGGMMTPFRLGGHVVYANSILPHEIFERFRDHKFTDMIVVPLFLKALMNGIIRESSKSKVKNLYMDKAFKVSRVVRRKKVRRLIFRPIIKKFGGMKRFVSGGSSLDDKVHKFFVELGFTVTRGYGLTETSPVATVAYKGDKYYGHEGKALAGTQVKIDPDTGEVLIKGPHVMKGYYKNPKLTSEVITPDGWFKSGDIGKIDKRGNLTIIGRHKELIVLGNGKKVFPNEVEQIYNLPPTILELTVVGAIENSGPLAGTETVCAVIVTSEKTESAREKIIKELRKQAEDLASYKRPTRFFFTETDLPKTNTKKSKRLLIKKMIEEGVFK